MWIARDRDGSLYLYEDKPVRGSRMFERDKTITYRYSDVAEVHEDFSPLSDVTWENSPKELIIK